MRECERPNTSLCEGVGEAGARFAKVLVVLAVAILTQTLSAQPVSAATVAVPFKAALGQIRRQVLKTKAVQDKIRALATAGEIRRLDSDANHHRSKVWRLERRLAKLRRRAQRLTQRRRRPPRRNDPFFRNDLRRFTWDLDRLRRDIERTARDAQRVAATAVKDPALVSPAQSFVSSADWLEHEARGPGREARWAHWDIRRAGFPFEAMDIDRDVDFVARAARSIHSEARRLLDKVR